MLININMLSMFCFFVFSEDFCLSEPCMNNATCSLFPSGYTCLCTDEYIGQHCQIGKLTSYFVLYFHVLANYSTYYSVNDSVILFIYFSFYYNFHLYIFILFLYQLPAITSTVWSTLCPLLFVCLFVCFYLAKVRFNLSKH